MTVPAEDIPAERARQVAGQYWGLDAVAHPLTGERDRNFHLVTADGAHYVLKFANPVEPAEITDLQIKGLLHIAAADPAMSVPRIIGEPRPGVRLLSWIHGVPLKGSRRSAVQREACGRTSARLGRALRGFAHPAADHPLIWDVAHTLRLREVLAVLGETAARDVVAGTLDAFARLVAPVLPGMRRQVLHNDMNTTNTLVEERDHDRLAGIIDFGDMVETALVIDVAVGVSSQLLETVPIGEAAAQFVAGYHVVTPLTRDEVALLPLLIAARLCQALVLPIWHLGTHPDNPHYAPMGADEIARRAAGIVRAQSPETALALRRACGFF